MSRYDTGYQLQQAGVISGRDSTVEAAATKLMYLHAQYHDDAEVIRKIMEIPIAGEITV
jgi:L-asparaginase